MNSLNTLQNIDPRSKHLADKYRHVPKPYLDFAQGMEERFTKHLLGEMNKTINKANPDSQANKIYNSFLDNERAKLMSESQTGLGIKDIVLDQVYPNWRNKPAQQALNTYQQVNSQKGERNE